MNVFATARIVLVATLMAAPLALGAVEPWSNTALSVLVVVALLCWAYGIACANPIQIVWTYLYIPLALFFVLAIAQLWMRRAANATGARDASISIGTDLLIFFLGVNLFATESRRTWSVFGWAVSLYMFAVALLAIAQYFSNPARIFWTITSPEGYIFGPYINHNHYAGLMELLIPLALGFLLSRPGTDPRRYLLAFAIVLSAVSVLTSGSRGGTTAVLVEFALFGYAICSAPSIRRRLLFVLPVAAVGFALWFVPSEVLQRFQLAITSPDITYAGRKALNMDALRIAQDHLLTGAGLGSFETVYPRYQTLATDATIDYAHNDYAQALAETGITGGTLLISTVVLFFIGFGRVLASTRASPLRWLRCGAAIGCCGILIHSWVDFNLHIPANAAWFALLAGLSQYSIDNSEHEFRTVA